VGELGQTIARANTSHVIQWHIHIQKRLTPIFFPAL